MSSPRTLLYRAAPFLALLLLAAFPLAARADWKDDAQAKWEEAKKKLDLEGPDKLPPVEELWNQAESYRTGHETWFGKIVAKISGPDSKAYEKIPGVKIKNLARARDLYRKLADNYPFSKYAPLSELRVADCHYDLEEYEQAAIWYEQFIKRRQRREEVPYAIYRKGMCAYQQMRKTGRDQEHAKEAAAIFGVLIEMYPDAPEAKDAAEKLKECKTRLAEHEMSIGEYYYKRKEYWAAAARFNGVWNGYPGMGFDAEAIFKEANCYDELGKPDLARPLYKKVMDKYSGTEWAQKAAEREGALPKEEKPK